MSKILIVEDNREHSVLLSIKLKAIVVVASDFASIMQRTSCERPDTILLDLGLPPTDGYAVMEMLQRSRDLSHIPVVVVSGRGRRTHYLKVIPSGASDFLQKPVGTEELLDVLRRVLASPA